MKRNFWYIFLTMIVAILGILIFQIYWISNTYDVQTKSFNQEVNSALEIVLNEEITNRTMNQIFGLKPGSKDTLQIVTSDTQTSIPKQPEGTSLLIEDSISFTPDTKSGDWSYQGYYEEEQWIVKDDNGYYTLRQEEFFEVFGNVVVSIVHSEPDLDEISVKFQDELKSRNIEIPFELGYVKQNVLVSFKGENADNLSESQVIKKIPGRQSDEVIMAFFPKTGSFILKRMWLTLLGSFLLFSLIAGSFLLMLQTILRQKKVSQVKNDFINNMTHEFKTPIATVSAAMEALVSFDGLSDKDRSLRYIDISRKEITRLSGLVEKVLNISLFEEKKIILNKETFDACRLLAETSQQYILKGNGRVEVNYDPDGSAYIYADKLHFQNVLNNLLDNAVKYSHETVLIDLKCKREGEYIVLTVKDNGIGISKEQQKHIFERFYRVPTGDLHGVKGFGLGLSYVKHIVEMHGGTVGIKSQPGSGSEFIIAIPDIHE
jgi:two-component system phosphate regulon sensor histidine kinase PhoR